MGTILYKPHCAKCGALIDDDIAYRGLIEHVVDSGTCQETMVMVYPNKCKCCGEPFSSIEIPLPRELDPAEVLWEY
jgi:DNA-directed RNA polymerase subunit RPC12/RpoP